MFLNQLIESSTGNRFNDKNNTAKNISVFNQLNNKPLVYGLENNLLKHSFEIIYKSPAQCGSLMLDGEIDIGFIPVTTYAKTKETWHIIPDISVSAAGKIKNVQLFFRKGLQEIKKIAIDERADASFVLLRILMQEKFNMTPEYEVIRPNLDEMLSKSDAALIISDEALHEQEINRSSFDLSEEWFDFTGLPMVFAFWAGRQMTVREEDVQIIKKSFELGIRNLEYIAKEFAEKSPFGWSFYHDYLTQNVGYAFSDQEQAGLKEFYNYAFFYGLIDYIPDLHFFEIG